jgi:hypothetical protein
MTWSAPSFLRISAFFSDDVVAMTVAPAALANYHPQSLVNMPFLMKANSEVNAENVPARQTS